MVAKCTSCDKTGKRLYVATVPGIANGALIEYLDAHIPPESTWLNLSAPMLKKPEQLERAGRMTLLSGNLPLPTANKALALFETFFTIVLFGDPYLQIASRLTWLHNMSVKQSGAGGAHAQLDGAIAAMKSCDLAKPEALQRFVNRLENEENYMFHDAQTRLFTVTGIQTRIGDKELQKALKLLRKIHAVGIRERIDEFMVTLGYRLGLPLPEASATPAASGLVDISNPEIRQVLTPLISCDLKLYEAAKARFIDQLHDTLKEVEKHSGGINPTTQLESLIPVREKTVPGALINTGIIVMQGEELAKFRELSKTIVVVGVARGGTSMVAGALDHLGIFTGERSRPPVFEDVALAEAYEQERYEDARGIIADYNTRYDIWAFKRPGAIDYLESLHKELRNPVYIFIFKDIFSVANRNTISMQQETVLGMHNALKAYEKILSFIEKNSPAGMMVSYDKVLEHKELFIDQLDAVFECGASEIRKEQARTFVTPNPTEYMDITRKTKAIGKVEEISDKMISGWAKYLHSNQAAKVVIYEGESIIKTTIANLQHKQGNCGFLVALDQPCDTAAIRVKVENEVVNLPICIK